MAKATNPRQIKRKIRAVQNLKKITKAMEMVSAAKLRRTQEALEAVRPYADKLLELMGRLAASAEQLEAPLLVARPVVRRVGLVVVAADKGLCGSYNSNVLRLAHRLLAEIQAPVELYTVGRKAREAFRKRGREPAAHWQGLPPNVGFREVREIVEQVVGAYRREELDEVRVVYTEFINAMTFRPRASRFLPLGGTAGFGSEAAGQEGTGGAARPAGGPCWLFEPSPERIFEQLLPRFVEVRFYRLLLEALASEHGARMQAMRNATDNAQELIDTLTLTFNKARQAAITKELLDIVGGAEGLRG
ncbi:MAG: ATP synthase subunit gamma [Planctomycetota bacterium]|nr:MAG: ATP synthase subunit gamma [Planctomycetota bacterium]